MLDSWRVTDRSRGDKDVLRLAGPVVFWWAWLAFVVANVVSFAVQGLPSAHFGAVVGAILLLVTALAYTLALRPKVIVSGDGLTVVNPYRTHRVPWPLIDSVDTGEWVQVHYAPRPVSTSGTSSPSSPSSAADKTLHCWALYVSARARHKINQASRLGGGAVLASSRAARAAEAVGHTRAASKLPDEARYLASLPVAKALAVRLDTRAARERGRADNRSGGPANTAATATWAWPALAAVVIPALVLIAVAIA